MKIVQPIRDRDKMEQIKTVLRYQSYRNYFLFVLGVNSGLRISDMLPLKVIDVKDKEYIILTEKKTGKNKRFIINPMLKKEIDAYIHGMNQDDYLFQSKIKKIKPITRVMAYIILNNAAQKVGLDEIGTHTLRKSFGYHFYQKYKDVALLQKIFNHSSPTVTLRYIGIDQDMQDEACKKFLFIKLHKPCGSISSISFTIISTAATRKRPVNISSRCCSFW